MFVKHLLNSFFPPECLICGERVDESGNLCPKCYASLKFVVPQNMQIFFQTLKDCSKARSAIQYDDNAKKIVLSLKYGDRLDAVPLLSRLMYNAGKDILDEADVLIPVPLHWRRLWVRKYNQAAVLAKCIGKISLTPSDLFSLKRSRSTPKQGHLSKSQRLENMKDAFCVENPTLITGKKIVLIDDVLTTGATLNTCAKALKNAGARDISVLTFACVIKE